MKKLNKLRQGFTLIELLIVVSIIGILSVALVPNLSGAPARARDAARKAMLSEVASAIETFNIDKGEYPDGDGCVNTTAPAEDSDLEDVVDNYLSGIPPTQNETGTLTDAAGTREITPTCDEEVHYTQLEDGYIIFVALEADRGGDYNIETLQNIEEDAVDAATVASYALTPSGDGNAHALIR